MPDPASTTDPLPLLDLTADIVSSFVGKNSIHAVELPALIASVHASLAGLAAPAAAPAPEPVAELKPAVPIKKSVTPDYIVSLEDGRRFRSLKRHLGARGMTPDDYRAKWGLPKDYPMVAPAYAAQRSELARASGLGVRRAADAELAAQTALSPVEPSQAAVLAPVVEQVTAEPPASEGKRRRQRKKAAADGAAVA